MIATLVLVFTVLLALPAAAQEPPACNTEWGGPRETALDRVVRIEDHIVPLPEVSRLEQSLSIRGSWMPVGSTRLWVEREGTDGPPLLLIPGGPGIAHHGLHPWFSRAAEYARVIYTDLRGTGLSDFADPETYTVETIVEDLEGLRRALGLERWVVLGHSFGGIYAQAYALRHPDRILGLVLVNSAAPMKVDFGLRERELDLLTPEELERIHEVMEIEPGTFPPVPDPGMGRSPEEVATQFFNGWLNGEWKRRLLLRPSVTLAARFARYEWVHDTEYFARILEDVSRLDFTGAFQGSPLATLLIESTWDFAFAARKPRLLHEQFPGSQMTVLGCSAHDPYMDQPERFFATLGAFLDHLPIPDPDALERWIESRPATGLEARSRAERRGE